MRLCRCRITTTRLTYLRIVVSLPKYLPDLSGLPLSLRPMRSQRPQDRRLSLWTTGTSSGLPSTTPLLRHDSRFRAFVNDTQKLAH